MPISPNVLLSRRACESLCDAIEAAAPSVLVLSGFVDGYGDFAKCLKARRPDISIMVLWHGTPIQLRDPDERRQYDVVISLLRSGVISRIGTFKTGEAAALVERGIDAMDVFNPPPAGAPNVSAGRVIERRRGVLSVGMFSAGPSWRKNPYAMIAAASRAENVEIYGVLDPAAQSYARSLGLKLASVREHTWTSEEMAAVSGRLDLNLYVSLSECSPLFPIESLHAGIPCLIGATSHLFLGSPLLFEETDAREVRDAAADAAKTLEGLVVSRADDPGAICDAIERVEANSVEIMSAYRVWCEPYRRAADASLGRLVGTPLTAGSNL